MDVLRQLIEDGVTECHQLADEMGVSPAKISRMAKKGMTEGWLKKKGREYQIAEGRVITVIDGEL
jgi:predicted transcriptional regulator